MQSGAIWEKEIEFKFRGLWENLNSCWKISGVMELSLGKYGKWSLER